MSPTAAIRTTWPDGESIIPLLLRLPGDRFDRGGRRRPHRSYIMYHDGQAACPGNGIRFAEDSMRPPRRGAGLERGRVECAGCVRRRGCYESGIGAAGWTRTRGARLLYADPRVVERVG